MTPSRSPLVSVVIAAYNAAQHVGRAVTSARAQSYPHVEIIVVDDGSVDDTAANATTAGATRVVTLQRNLGVSTARNIGTSVATGELIGYLDSDDEMTPDKLERQVARLTAADRADCVLTNQRIVLAPGASKPRWLQRAPGMLDTPSPVAMSAVIRASALVLAGGFDPELRTSEDMDLLMRMRSVGAEIVEIPDGALIRHVRGDNATYNDESIDRDLLTAVSRLTHRRIRPAASVIIPIRNGADYIGQAIASVRQQSAIDPATIEVVVVDDGSTDDSASIARQVDPDAIVVSQPPLGPGAARNHGVLLSRGEHLAFLDADDVWTPDRLRLQLEKLDQGADVVFGAVTEFIDPGLSPDKGAGLRVRPDAVSRVPAAMLIRREAFARAGRFSADMTAPDAVLWYANAVDAGLTMTDIDDVVLRRRLHGDNHSLREAMAQTTYPAALKQILDRRRRGRLP